MTYSKLRHFSDVQSYYQIEANLKIKGFNGIEKYQQNNNEPNINKGGYDRERLRLRRDKLKPN